MFGKGYDEIGGNKSLSGTVSSSPLQYKSNTSYKTSKILLKITFFVLNRFFWS